MAQAKKSSWFVISMKNDWKRIFAFEKRRGAREYIGTGEEMERDIASYPYWTKVQ